MRELEHILHFLDKTFDPKGFPDYPNALNGLQVEGSRTVERVAVAVDASEMTIAAAVSRGVDFLLVHHGLFWNGLGPLTGARYRKVDALIQGHLNLYGLHLPLDAHRDLGNNTLLLRGLGLEPEGRFGFFQEVEIGWWGRGSGHRDALLERVRGAVDGEARLIPGGVEEVARVGVLTGAGASAMDEALALDLDVLITGEAPHHAYHDAMEKGINLVLGGHYATETFGVRAVGEALSEEFDLPWEFLDFPTGL